MKRFAGDKVMILMASSTGTPAGRGSGVGSFRVTCNRLLMYQVIEVFTKSVYSSTLITSLLYTFLPRDKKNTSSLLMTHFCE